MKSKGFTQTLNIGDFLKAAREDLDLSQVKVMEITGINNKTLSGYENGVSEPDLQTLATLANLYGFSVDRLLNINGLTPQEAKLLNEFRKLSKSEKDMILTQVKATARNKQ